MGQQPSLFLAFWSWLHLIFSEVFLLVVELSCPKSQFKHTKANLLAMQHFSLRAEFRKSILFIHAEIASY